MYNVIPNEQLKYSLGISKIILDIIHYYSAM